MSWAWWFTLAIFAPEKLRQEVHYKIQVSMDYARSKILYTPSPPTARTHTLSHTKQEILCSSELELVCTHRAGVWSWSDFNVDF